jgi:hypothetical protein
MDSTGGMPPRARGRSRRLLTATQLFVLGAIVACVTAGAVSFHITHSGETAGGVETSTDFLSHWQQTASELGAIPRAVPATLSVVVGTPTVLAAANTRYDVNAGTAGHAAALWVLSETVGITVKTELELKFVVHYLSGTTATTFSGTSYVETQATAIAATYTFTLYFDTGAATGITLESQFELSQVCSAVGTCP